MMGKDIAELKHLDLWEGVEARAGMICPSYPSVQADQATSRHPYSHRGLLRCSVPSTPQSRQIRLSEGNRTAIEVY